MACRRCGGHKKVTGLGGMPMKCPACVGVKLKLETIEKAIEPVEPNIKPPIVKRPKRKMPVKVEV